MIYEVKYCERCSSNSSGVLIRKRVFYDKYKAYDFAEKILKKSGLRPVVLAFSLDKVIGIDGFTFSY